MRYEINPSVLLASASVSDYGRKGSGRGYTNLGDGSEDGAKSIRQAAQYLNEVGFHGDPQGAIKALAKRTGADPTALRKTAAGYTALDEAARRIETTPGDVRAQGVGNFRSRNPKDRPAAKARPVANSIGKAMEMAGFAAAGQRPVRGTEKAQVNTENMRDRLSAQGQPTEGQPTGPRPRKVANRLERATKRAVPEISGMTDPRQAEFAANLAKDTGLSPRVVAAWVRQEGGNPNGDNNWLNIGWTGSGPAQVTNAPDWQNPKTAAKATADWLRGKFGQQYGYVASGGIQSILGSVGAGDRQQINAITNSGWAGDPAYTENVTRNYNEISADAGKSVPKQLVQRGNKVLGKQATKALLAGGKLVRDPKAGKQSGPSKADQRWGGAVGAVHAVLPKKYWADARGDKRTPAENAAVGGAADSDHLTTNKNSFAADLPADDNLAKQIADNLGLPTHTGLQTVERDGVRYQLIWQAAGHYDHVHLGAEIIDPSKAPFAGDANIPIPGTKLAVRPPPTPTAASGGATGTTAAASGAPATNLAGAINEAQKQQRAAGAPGLTLSSAAAGYARSALNRDATDDPIYDAFRPKR